MDNNSSWGHGMNAILIGSDPTNFNDWCFIEPQTDSMDVKPGEGYFIKDCWVSIGGMENFDPDWGSPDMPKIYGIVNFSVDTEGNASFEGKRDGLITTRPIDLPVIKPDTNGTYVYERPIGSSPLEYMLGQNYPNPFNSRTNVDFNLSKPSHVNLTIYDILGREIKSIVDENKREGAYKVNIDLSNQPSGTYLMRMQTDDAVETKRITLVK